MWPGGFHGTRIWGWNETTPEIESCKVAWVTGRSHLIVMNVNHRGTECTENTDSSALLGWKEATEAAFGRDVDSIYSPRTRGTSVFSVPLW